MEMNVFEIEAMLFICLYQRFFTFEKSFNCDTLMTKSPFCLNFRQCLMNCSDMQLGRSQNNVAWIRNVEMSTKCQISAARFWSYDMPNSMCLQRVVGKAFQTVSMI